MSDNLMSARFELRLTEEEKELFQRAADLDHRPLANWMRDRLLRAAREELGGDGGQGKGRRRPPPR
jgi:uncharacterized protein (DUF1778 family)